MSLYKIFHNPNCSKSREALEILSAAKIEPEVIAYMEKKPTFNELKKVVAQLKLKPIDIVRKKETLYKELALETASDRDILEAIARYPELLERPIILKDSNDGVIGRPPENVRRLIG